MAGDDNSAERVELARKGLSWAANADGPLVLTGATYLTTFRLDGTQDMIDSLGGALLEIGYRPAPGTARIGRA